MNVPGSLCTFDPQAVRAAGTERLLILKKQASPTSQRTPGCSDEPANLMRASTPVRSDAAQFIILNS